MGFESPQDGIISHWYMGVPWMGYGRPLGHNGRPAGPLAVQFACFDASSGIQQRIGELNHLWRRGGGGGTNQLSVDLGGV